MLSPGNRANPCKYWYAKSVWKSCESCAIAKTTAQCALYVDALKIFGTPDYAHGYYSQNFSWAIVPIDPMNVPTKFEVRSYTCSWDNRGYPKNLGSPCIRSLFSKIFMGFIRIGPVNVLANFEVHSFTRSRDNRGYPKNLDSRWMRPRSIFSKNFNGLLFGMAM